MLGRRKSSPEDEYYTGIWNGERVMFKRNFRGHRFTKQECEDLCSGCMIEIHNIQGRNGKIYAVKGRLSHKQYGFQFMINPDRSRLVGFESVDIIPNDSLVYQVSDSNLSDEYLPDITEERNNMNRSENFRARMAAILAKPVRQDFSSEKYLKQRKEAAVSGAKTKAESDTVVSAETEKPASVDDLTISEKIALLEEIRKSLTEDVEDIVKNLGQMTETNVPRVVGTKTGGDDAGRQTEAEKSSGSGIDRLLSPDLADWWERQAEEPEHYEREIDRQMNNGDYDAAEKEYLLMTSEDFEAAEEVTEEDRQKRPDLFGSEERRRVVPEHRNPVYIKGDVSEISQAKWDEIIQAASDDAAFHEWQQRLIGLHNMDPAVRAKLSRKAFGMAG